MSGNDPRKSIEQNPMSRAQWLAVAIMIGLNALDGFDVLSSAFAGPGIKAEWKLAPDGLAAVLSMELIGMGFGSLLLGGAADKYGRRPTILCCLLLMAAGMFLAAGASSPQTLSAWRFMTGIGIGGMLAAVNAVTSEFSNLKSRSLCIALMVIGYPLGAYGGGLIAANLLKTYDWQSVFLFGAIMTTLFIPAVWFFVPETPDFLNRRRPVGALEKINRTLTRFKHAPIKTLEALPPTGVKSKFTDIFSPALLRSTLLLAFGYSFHALTFYFILKWTPTILSDPQIAGQNFTRPEGASVLAYANLGGAVGGAIFGWFMHRFGIKRATLTALAMSVVMVIWFGTGQSTLSGWTMAVFAVGLFTNSAIVGYYAAFAAAYPAELRATGTGFALSIGRGGAALSPYLAGLLFANHSGLFNVSMIMALGSLASVLLFAMLKIKDPAKAN
jgi:benzoate transport